MPPRLRLLQQIYAELHGSAGRVARQLGTHQLHGIGEAQDKVVTIGLSGSGLGRFAALAQPSTGGPTPASAATAVPLDGGASLLLAGGIGYAVRKLRQRRLQ